MSTSRNALLAKIGSNVRLRCCYNVVLVRLLYAAIPEEHRSFMQDESAWYISESHEQTLKKILEKLNFIISYEGQEAPANADEFSVLGLLPSAPFEVCEAAYRALCKLHHPDTGGDPEKMKQLNVAWLKIKVTKKL